MIAADFLGDPTSTGLDIPSQTDRASAALTAGICGPFFFFGCNSAHGTRRLHGRTKLAGEGRLWMMRCAPLISIVGLHGADLAAGDAPQQLDISQTHPCEWRTDKQEAVGHFSFLAAIALTEPVASTAARSWPARDAYG